MKRPIDASPIEMGESTLFNEPQGGGAVYDRFVHLFQAGAWPPAQGCWILPAPLACEC